MGTGRRFATVSGVIGIAAAAAYLAIAMSEDDRLQNLTLVFFAAMLIGSAFALLAWPLNTRWLLVMTAGIFVVIGTLGIFSIGVPFLVAGLLAIASFMQFEPS